MDESYLHSLLTLMCAHSRWLENRTDRTLYFMYQKARHMYDVAVSTQMQETPWVYEDWQELTPALDRYELAITSDFI